MSIKELAEELKARPGMRIRIANAVPEEGAEQQKYTPALTDAQILAYGNLSIVHSQEEGNTIFCTVI